MIALVLLVVAHAEAANPWPPLAPPRNTVPPAIAADIERVWRRPTITRRIDGERVQTPFDLHAALIDNPDVTAAAARHLKLAPYDARPLGANRYHVDDGAGTQGEYQVLLRERAQRVMFAHGRHTGRFGTLKGMAIVELRLEPQSGGLGPRLTAWVLVENRYLAVAAWLLTPLIGRVADWKVQEGFRVAARVSEWAATRPVEFCQWLAREPLSAEARHSVRAVVPRCVPPVKPPPVKPPVKPPPVKPRP